MAKSVMKPLLQCPNYGSEDIKKNGTPRHGRQNYKCRGCGRQFAESPKWRRISHQTKVTINRLLLERVLWAGIGRSLELSESYLQQYVNAYYRTVPQQVQSRPKPRQRLIQMDELWSFVDDCQG